MNAEERILWQGQPKQGLRVRTHDLFLIPFSLLWCGFAVFWTVSVIATSAPFIMKIFGLAFVGIGMYFVFGRFLVESYQRRHTWYTLTDQRAIITATAPRRIDRSVDLHSVTNVSVETQHGGWGTVLLGPAPAMPFSRIGFGRNNAGPPAFDVVQDAASIYSMIVDVRQCKKIG
ncbi:MAG: hypothetical protein IPJ76_11300 [Flavobacteriales bacterium]|nr:MAG: hypothetical protein IPJ76_11300 [Flavobacteriales bacterium]